MSSTIDFVHLHVHTEFSMLDGLGKISPLVAKAKELNQKSLAITDHGGMYGVVHFYNQCLANNIKPLIGVEAYLAKNSRFDKQVKMGSDQFHLTLLAENFTGYQNLMRLVSAANLEGFSYKPRIDFELLKEHSQGIIVLSGCMSSIFNQYLLQGEIAAAEKEVNKYLEVFGDRFYIELQAHPKIKDQKKLTKLQVELARKFNIELVATNDVHYIEQDEAVAQDALLCVQTESE